MIGSFSVYVIVDPAGDRPYVSTTPPSVERQAIAKSNGWLVYKAEFDQDVFSEHELRFWARRVV